MAEIDRAILSSLDRRKIVETVLSRVRAFLPCDYVNFSLFEFDSIASGQNYMGKKTPNREYLADPFHLTSEEKEELPNVPDILLVETELARGPYRGPLEKQGAKWILVLPIMFEQRLLGIIALGYLQRSQQTQQDERRARQLADQVAVAMANAHLVEARERAEKALQEINAELELRVKDRTSELTLTNENLQQEIKVRKRTELQLQEAKNVAEMANRIKSDFLANMSHELRTPLNAIIGFNEMLVDKKLGDLTDIQLDMLKDMLESSYHLLSLINDILDLSKVEAGKLELSTTTTNLEDLLSRSLVIVQEKASKNNIKLSVDAKDIPTTIEADERKLKQVIYNLLSNALKFTPEGGSVSLKARNLLLVNGHFETTKGERFDLEGVKEDLKETQQTEFLMISVEDTGIGIKLEDQARVFDPFEQAESSLSRKYQGTGLGLPLTKKLIELHGGRMWLESAGEGRGSSFTFVIPT
jgi:signal transduction histidine kinase